MLLTVRYVRFHTLVNRVFLHINLLLLVGLFRLLDCAFGFYLLLGLIILIFLVRVLVLLLFLLFFPFFFPFFVSFQGPDTVIVLVLELLVVS